MGANGDEGVINTSHEVFGHPGLYVVDASAISANLGVSPSLTITALAERFASLVAPAAGERAATSGPAGAGAASPDARSGVRYRDS